MNKIDEVRQSALNIRADILDYIDYLKNELEINECNITFDNRLTEGEFSWEKYLYQFRKSDGDDHVDFICKKVLEDGESISELSFEEALEYVKQGYGMVNGYDGSVIRIQYPDCNSKMTIPYLYMETRSGNVPWTPNNRDLFTTEWEVIW